MNTDGWKTKPKVALASVLVMLACSAFAYASPKYKVLHAFGRGTDGGGLWSPVTLDKKGNLYGATSGGGAYNGGIVFRLTPHPDGKWTESILHSFPSTSGDAAAPNGGLIQDGSGNWYGTSTYGGSYYVGAVFEMTNGPKGWTVTVLYSFGEHSDDGDRPTAGVVMDRVGSLYGTAPGSYSMAFELSPEPGTDSWNETILHHFGVKEGDGSAPYAGLVLDQAGNLYGTTYGGGAYNGGTVYELERTANGWKEKILHAFAVNYHDGHTPGWGALAMDASGSLYGTTAGGGCCGGVIYRLTPDAEGHWRETILYEFKGGAEGFEAGAGVVMDNAGNLYGTTVYGGDPGCGVVYKLAPEPKDKWKYTVLHTFGYGNDGCQPDANLILDGRGNLYGTTAIGGAYGAGVVFELTP